MTNHNLEIPIPRFGLPLVFIGIGALLIVLAFFLPKSTSYKTQPTARSEPTVAQASAPRITQTASNGGVDVTIESVATTAEQTTVRLNLSNHQFDLSDPSIQMRSTLDGKPATEFRVLDAQTGGHHVEAELTFPPRTNGELIIGVTENITINFTLL